MHVGVHSSSGLGLFPKERSLALQRAEPELDELGLSVVADKAKGVHTEAICMPVGTNGTMSTHCPHKSVHAARLLTEKVPGAVMGRCCLRDLPVWLGLDRMNQVWKLDSVLDKKYRYIVANNI